MGAYTKEQNENIIKALNLYNAGMSRQAILKEVPVSKRTLYRWIEKFDINGERTDIRCTMKKELYLEEVLRLHYQEGYKSSRIAQLLHLSPTTVWKWITNFEAENGKPQEMKKTEQSEIEALKQQVADLEEQLRIEKMRGRLNDKIIEIAEKKYGIEIRKKAGAKQ
jgi:transposase